MLLRTSLPANNRRPRRWAWTAAALALLVVSAHLRAGAAPPDPPAKEELPGPDIDKIIKNLPPNLSDEQVKTIRKQLEDARESQKKAFAAAREAQAKAEEAQRKMWEDIQRRNPFGGLGAVARQREERLGVRLERPTDVLIAQLGLPEGQGVVVAQVKPDSPAGKAGLKVNDILLQLDGKPVPSNGSDFAKRVDDLKAGAAVDMTVKRAGKEETLKGLTLPEVPPRTPPRPTTRPIPVDDARLGVRLETPSAVLADQLDLPSGQGLVIVDEKADFAAAKAGLKVNDVLLQLDGKPVPNDPREFTKAVEDLKAGAPVDAVVRRKGKEETIKGVTLPERRKKG